MREYIAPPNPSAPVNPENPVNPVEEVPAINAVEAENAARVLAESGDQSPAIGVLGVGIVATGFAALLVRRRRAVR